MRTFRWLHFADLHQGLAPGWHWPNAREVLLSDLERLHSRCGPWDLVLFTGDLTQRGTSAEFARLNETLQALWDHLGTLGSTPALVAVPGNHDLVRPDPRLPEVLLLSRWDTSPEAQVEFWCNPASPYRARVFEAFKPYSEWLSSHPFPRIQMQNGVLPGDCSAVLTKDELRLGIVGLNSAFLQLNSDDHKGRLALDVRQFHGACGGDGPAWVKNCDFALLLSHHSPSWLSLEAREALLAEISPPGRFVAHMFGHGLTHSATTLAVGGAQARRELQCGSLFSSETHGDGRFDRRHGYIAAQLMVDDQNEAVLRLWPRVAKKLSAGHWRIAQDDSSFELDDDQGTIPEKVPFAQKTLLSGPIYSSRGDAPKPRPKVSVATIDDRVESYRQRLAEQLDHFRSLAIDDAHVRFSQIYEPLDLRMPHSKEGVSVDLIHVIMSAMSCRLIVEDGAGMGKSSMLRRVALNLLRDTQETPLLLPLRRLHRNERIADLAARTIADEGQISAEELRSRFIVGGFAFLLDGFDEIDSDAQAQVLREIEALETNFPSNRYVVTSRPEQALAFLEKFETARVCPMSRDKANGLIMKYGVVTDLSKAQRLIRRIEHADLVAVGEFLSCPMMVALLFRTFVDAERLPARRTEFFDAVYRDLFSGHDWRKGGYRRIHQSGLSQDEFRLVVERLAWTTSLHGRVECSAGDVMREMESALAYVGTRGVGPASFLHDILQCVPLMYDDGGRVSWVHRSLQDYFAASFVQRLSLDRRQELLGGIYTMLETRSFQGFLSMYRDLDNQSFRSDLVLRVLREYGEKVYGDARFLAVTNSEGVLGKRIQFEIEQFRVCRYTISSLKILASRLGIERDKMSYVAHDVCKRHPVLLRLLAGKSGGSGGGVAWEKDGYYYEIQYSSKSDASWHILAMAANALVSPEYEGLYWSIREGSKGLQQFQDGTEALFEFIPPDVWVLSSGQTLDMISDVIAESTPLIVKYAEKLVIRARRLLDPMGVVAIRTKIEQEIADVATFNSLLRL